MEQKVTDAEYAFLSALVYNAPGSRDEGGSMRILRGWEPVGSIRELPDGLAMGVFKKGNELVIAFRGTDSGLDRSFDLDDWPAARGKMSSQIQRALQTMFQTLFDVSLRPSRLI
jgi:hypothetical protein